MTLYCGRSQSQAEAYAVFGTFWCDSCVTLTFSLLHAAQVQLGKGGAEEVEGLGQLSDYEKESLEVRTIEILCGATSV